MQTYTDLILLSIIGGAVLLLLLLLIFFVLLQRRCSEVERAGAAELNAVQIKLQHALTEAAGLQTKLQALQQQYESQQKKLSSAENQLSYLRSTQDECIDELKELRERLGQLQVHQDVQQKLIEEQDPDHESLLQAKKLIAKGLPLDEVQKLTGMPRAELDMLKSVQDQKSAQEEAALAKAQAAAKPAPTLQPQPGVVDLNAPEEKAEEPLSIEDQAHALSEAFVQQHRHAEAPAPQPQRPAASLRARSAYGIKSLRGRGH